MSLTLLGRCGFEDAIIPIKGKTEWGVDTLVRKMRGSRLLAEDYNATLVQGLEFQGYFLQTWDCDDDPVAATFTLNYKGFVTGGTPRFDAQNEIAPATGSVSAEYTAENEGKGRHYRDVIWRSFLQAESGAQTEVVNGTLPVYTTGAQLEFTYDAVQTTYRYISLGKPYGPRFFSVDMPRIPVVKRARLTTADGSVYGKTHPAAFDDLEPEVVHRVLHASKQIIGTPYWECQDVVRRELGEGDSDDQGSFVP